MRVNSALAAAADNARWGIRGAVFFGCAYSVIVLILYAIGGRESFEAKGVALGSLIAAYLLGGLAAGIVVGLLRPLLRWQIGAMFVGVTGAVPAAIGIGVARYGAFGHWSAADTGSVVVVGGILGMLFGNRYWKTRHASDTDAASYSA